MLVFRRPHASIDADPVPVIAEFDPLPTDRIQKIGDMVCLCGNHYFDHKLGGVVCTHSVEQFLERPEVQEFMHNADAQSHAHRTLAVL